MKYSINDFTIEQKIKLLAGKDFWHTEDFDGKIYKVKVSDGPVGLRMPVCDENGKWYDKPSVAYPSTQVLSQTWDEKLAYETGERIADDCIENGVDVLLAPGLNIKRNPLCGRNFEYVSEDPYLAGVFGREYVKGIQAHHVGATIKHFCANNQELCRWWVSSEIDERTLREIYLEPFRIAEEGKPWAVMCAYNLVNGVRMSEHAKLYKILREEFGHGDRLIMSDWEAVQDHVASVKAGLDLEMPYLESGYVRLKEGFENGEITEEEIDACVKRVLDFINLCEEQSALRKVQTTVEQRLQSAQKVAENGIVLLKNDGALPVKDNANISITGNSAVKYISGDGSSRVQPITKTPVGLPYALEKTLSGATVSYKGVDDHYQQTYVAVNNAYGKDVAIVCVDKIDGEGWDRHGLKLDKRQEMLIVETAKQNSNTVVVMYCGAPVDMSAWIDKVNAVIWAGYPGEMGAYAIANIISGKVNPSGKLTESFPLTLEDSVAEYTHSDFMKVDYAEGLRVGYRYYDSENQNGLTTLFPFGYGLSYSTFEYKNMSVEVGEQVVKVAFDITNTSQIDGAEVAQIYVREVHPKVYRPYKELKAFKKVSVGAGQTARVEVQLGVHAFEYYSVALDKWTHTPGSFEILVGASAENILLKQSVEIKQFKFYRIMRRGKSYCFGVLFCAIFYLA